MGFNFVATVVFTAVLTLLARWVISEYLAKRKQSPKKSEVPETSSEKPAPQYITFGSTKQEVLAVLGTPKNVINRTWYYKPGYVEFSFDKVVHVHAYVDESYMRFRVDPSML